MKRSKPAQSPDAYVEALDGWRRATVEALRSAVTSVPTLEETIKWGHLIYSANGPVLLIRAEPSRVLFGFWRGQRLQDIEPRLRASGKYEMGTLELKEGMSIQPTIARQLAREAAALNMRLGDPTEVAKAGGPKR